MRKIYMYCNNGRKPIEEFLDKAHPKIKKKFQHLINYIRNENQILCEPYVKHFSIERYKMFYEIRLKASRTMVRIVFFERNENIILLHAFYKKNRRDTEGALEYTLKLVKSLDGASLLPFENLCEVEC